MPVALINSNVEDLYLSNRLHRAYVGVRPEQNMLQLGLLLIDPFHRQTLLIFLGLTESLILKQTLKIKRHKNNVTANKKQGKIAKTN